MIGFARVKFPGYEDSRGCVWGNLAGKAASVSHEVVSFLFVRATVVVVSFRLNKHKKTRAVTTRVINNKLMFLRSALRSRANGFVQPQRRSDKRTK